MGHIPPLSGQGLDNMLQSCRLKYLQTISKYSDIIVASFYGHVNADTITYVTEDPKIKDPVQKYQVTPFDMIPKTMTCMTRKST